jgi:rhodanese-related sulfurtransferase
MFLTSLLLAATLAKADVARVQPAELRALMQKGEAVAVDVRGSVPYELGHITGAVWMPLGLLKQRAGELPEDQLIVTYCTCKAEETSLEGALMLANELGFARVGVLHGGYPAWKSAGFPVEEQRTVPFPEESTEAAPASGGRLRPPAAVSCDRNELTSYAGKVTHYKRLKDRTTFVMNTSADTVETISIRHSGSDDPSRFYLIGGTPFTASDWSRIESKKGVLRPDMSAVAWVCRDGVTIVDWRPGTTFTGAE